MKYKTFYFCLFLEKITNLITVCPSTILIMVRIYDNGILILDIGGFLSNENVQNLSDLTRTYLSYLSITLVTVFEDLSLKKPNLGQSLFKFTL